MKKTVAVWPSATDEAFCASTVATTISLPPDFVTLAMPIADCVRSPRVAVAMTWIAVGVAPAAGVVGELEPPQPETAAASAGQRRGAAEGGAPARRASRARRGRRV